MRTKKLLAILLSLALLIGLVPAAGMLTTTAEVDLTAKVIEIDFTTGAGDDTVDSSYWCLSMYNVYSSGVTTDLRTDAQTNGADYTFSFEYYLDSDTYIDADMDTSSAPALDWPGGYNNYVSGDKTLQPGRHSFTLTERRTNTNDNMQTYPRFRNIAEDAKLYVWNVKATLNGTPITAYSGGTDGVKDVYHSTYTSATVTNEKALSSYPFAPNEDGSAKVQQVYVDQTNGSDETGDGSETAPYASLYQAMTTIENSLYLEGAINIVGTYAPAASDPMFTSTSTPVMRGWAVTMYTKPVTIQGADDTAVLDVSSLANGLWIGGPTTIDNITVKVKNSSATNIYAWHQRLSVGANVTFTNVSGGSGMPSLYTGFYRPTNANAANYTSVNALTLDGGAFNAVWLGNHQGHYGIANARKINGVNYVQNAGAVSTVYVGHNGTYDTDGCNGGNIYTDDVNVTINGGTITSILVEDKVNTNYTNDYAVATTFSGYALQIILNNGVTAPTLPTAADVTAKNGTLYILKCASGGSQLAVTETAGTYTVANHNYTAVATGTDAEGNAVEKESVDGVLTVPAGTYTVTWKAAENFTVYVDDTGSDTDGDGTLDTPYATLAKALQIVEASGAAGGVINVVNTLTLDAMNDIFGTYTATASVQTPNFTVPVTVQGANGTNSVITLTSNVRVAAPMTFNNITINTNSKTFYNTHNSVTFGADAVITGTPNVFTGRYDAGYHTGSTAVNTLTLNAGTFGTVRLGNYAAHEGNNYARTIAGVNVLLDGATVSTINLGHQGNSDAYNKGGNIFTDDVNVTVNSGTLTTVAFTDCTNTTATAPSTLSGHALQIILNNGGTATVPTADEIAKMDGKLYVLNGAEGVYLTATEEAGVYTVPTDKIAVAKNGDTVVAVSYNGTLTVSAGTYTVEYAETAPYTYEETDTGSTITINEALTLDFAGILHKEIDGALFKGYVDSEGNVAKATLPAGTVLTAQYVANWNDDTDNDGKGNSFYIVGSSLREAKAATDDTTEVKQALRFIVELKKSVFDNFETVSYGTVLIPNTILSVNDLELNSIYTYKYMNYSAASVEGKKLYRDGETYIQYTAALTGIAEKNYLTAYAARGYMTYTDLNGVERTVYTGDTNASSLNEVAEQLIDKYYNETEANNDADIAVPQTITAAAKAYITETKYPSTAYTALTPNNDTSLLIHNQVMNDSVNENGEYYVNDQLISKFYKLNGKTSLTVREMAIAANGDNANSGETVVVQVSDMHINYCNDEDFAEGNIYTLDSWEKRLDMNSHNGYNGEHYTIDAHRQAMEYAAAIGDQTVVTGDIMDYLSYGNLEYAERLISEPYSNALMTLGNHDPSRWAGQDTDLIDPAAHNAYYDLIRKSFTNDLDYTSKMVGKEVLVIQLDNSNHAFTATQYTALTADLAKARTNGYTVLLFMHIPITPTTEHATIYGSGSLTSTVSRGTDDTTATAQVYDLITGYGDVVRGIFNGHEHIDVYSELAATDADGAATTIPQYTVSANFISYGNVLKITVN